MAVAMATTAGCSDGDGVAATCGSDGGDGSGDSGGFGVDNNRDSD